MRTGARPGYRLGVPPAGIRIEPILVVTCQSCGRARDAGCLPEPGDDARPVSGDRVFTVATPDPCEQCGAKRVRVGVDFSVG